MEKDRIGKLALATATTIVAISSESISSWIDEIKVQKNIDIHGAAHGGLILDSVIFGHYYIGEKIKRHMNEDDSRIFEAMLKEKVIFMISFALKSDDKTRDANTHNETIRKLYDEFMPEKHEALVRYKGGTILDLLKAGFWRTFNENDFGVKFFRNTLMGKLVMKFCLFVIMGTGGSQLAKDTFVDGKVLDMLADTIFARFSSCNYDQLNHDAEVLL
jgi:hypothetical protein